MITTHVLDTTRGAPAAGLRVRLARIDRDGAVALIGEATTDADGRARNLTAGGSPLAEADYRLDFDTGAYFASLGVEAFYPRVSVTFTVRDPERHHHVPLLLSPWGYTTYRGS